MTRRATFTQADVEREIRDALASGRHIEAIEIKPGGEMRVVLAPPALAERVAGPVEEWLADVLIRRLSHVKDAL